MYQYIIYFSVNLPESKIEEFGNEFIEVIKAKYSQPGIAQEEHSIRYILEKYPLPGTKKLAAQMPSIKMFLFGRTCDEIVQKL